MYRAVYQGEQTALSHFLCGPLLHLEITNTFGVSALSIKQR